MYSVVAFALFAGIATLIALCGCCCRCLKGGCGSRTCVYLYGTCLLPVMIIFLALGIAMAGFMQVSEEIDKQCPKIIDYAMELYSQGDSSFEFDEEVQVYDLTYINTFMCTDVCPCKDVPTKN